jgi:hypothetical protein
MTTVSYEQPLNSIAGGISKIAQIIVAMSIEIYSPRIGKENATRESRGE